MEQLTDINSNKQKISELFGRPNKMTGNVWVYLGIHIVKDQKIQSMTIRVTFDPSGTQSQVTVVKPETKRRPPEGGSKSK